MRNPDELSDRIAIRAEALDHASANHSPDTADTVIVASATAYENYLAAPLDPGKAQLRLATPRDLLKELRQRAQALQTDPDPVLAGAAGTLRNVVREQLDTLPDVLLDRREATV